MLNFSSVSSNVVAGKCLTPTVVVLGLSGEVLWQHVEGARTMVRHTAGRLQQSSTDVSGVCPT